MKANDYRHILFCTSAFDGLTASAVAPALVMAPDILGPLIEIRAFEVL
jgi:hypothetical protein